jgi:hypothetical protein
MVILDLATAGVERSGRAELEITCLPGAQGCNSGVFDVEGCAIAGLGRARHTSARTRPGSSVNSAARLEPDGWHEGVMDDSTVYSQMTVLAVSVLLVS